MNCFFSFTWTFTAPFFNIHTKLPLLYVLTRLTFSIGRYGNVALFFLHCPLNFAISSEFFDISTSYQLPFTISRLCHPLMPQTDRDHKSFNREKNARGLAKKHEYPWSSLQTFYSSPTSERTFSLVLL